MSMNCPECGMFFREKHDMNMHLYYAHNIYVRQEQNACRHRFFVDPVRSVDNIIHKVCEKCGYRINVPRH